MDPKQIYAFPAEINKLTLHFGQVTRPSALLSTPRLFFPLHQHVLRPNNDLCSSTLGKFAGLVTFHS